MHASFILIHAHVYVVSVGTKSTHIRGMKYFFGVEAVDVFGLEVSVLMRLVGVQSYSGGR